MEDSLIKSLGEAIIITDQQFRITGWNPAAEKLYGWAESEVIGCLFHELIETRYLSETPGQEALPILLHDGHWSGEVFQNSRDGSELIIGSTISVIRGEADQATGYIAVNRDINRFRASDRDVEHIRTVFSATTDLLAFMDRDYRYLFVNQAFATSVRMEVDQIVGKTIAEVMGEKSFQELIKARFDKALGGVQVSFQTWVPVKDSIRLYFNITYDPIISADGQVSGVVATIRNLTDLQSRHEELVKNEQFIRLISDTTPAIIYVYDHLEDRNIWVNSRHREVIGDTDREKASVILQAAFHPDDWLRILQRDEKLRTLPPGDWLEMDYRMKLADGKWHTFHDQAAVFARNEEGETLQTIGAAMDITERKRSEDRLEQFRKLISTTPDAIALVDCDYRYLIANEAYGFETGYEPREIEGRTIPEVFGEKRFYELIKPYMDLCLEGESVRYQETFAYPDGEQHHLDVRYVPFRDEADDIIGAQVTIRDITDLVASKQALNISEERASALLKAVPDMIFRVNRTGIILDFHGEKASLFYRKPTDLKNMRLAKVLPPQAWKVAEAFLEMLFETGEMQVFNYELPIHSGSLYWEARLVKSGPDEALAIIRDITENIQAEKALKESEERYRSVVTASPLSISVMQEEEIVFANPACARILGYDSADEIVGLPVSHTLSPESFVAVKEQLAARADVNHHDSLILELHRRDGNALVVESTSLPIVFEGRPASLLIAQDLTERIKAERSLKLYSQKLEILRQASITITTELDIDRLLPLIIERGLTLVGATEGSVFLYNKDSGYLERSYAIEGRLKANFDRFRPGEGVTGQVFQTGKPLIMDDLSQWEPASDLSDHYREIAILSAPVTWGGNILGVINAIKAKGRGTFTEEDSYFLSLLADQAAIMLHHGALYQNMRQLTRQIVEVQEEERRRVAYELHDDAGQALTALKIGLELLKKSLNQENIAAQQKLTEITQLASEISNRIRNLAQGLRPPALDTLGLKATLEGLCREQSEMTGLEISFAGSELPPIPDEISISLYRVCQEALTNITRHAKAKRIEVRVNVEDQMIILAVTDDGIGFDPVHLQNVSPKGKGLGLKTMRDRVDLLRGQLIMDSRQDKGTRIIARIPLEGDI